MKPLASPVSNPTDIRKAASWIAEPKQGGARRRTMFAYEKGLIWGNDNYRTNGALVNIALATGNVGRPGGGLRPHGRPSGRLCQARLSRRKAGALCRSAVDRRQGRCPPHLGVRPLQDDAQRDGIRARLQEADRSREVRDERHPIRRSRSHGRGDHGRDPAGWPLQRRCRHCADEDRPGLPISCCLRRPRAR